MMTDNELQYHLNFRQKDLYEAAKQYRLVRLAEQARGKSNGLVAFLNPFVKLTIIALIVYELSTMI